MICLCLLIYVLYIYHVLCISLFFFKYRGTSLLKAVLGIYTPSKNTEFKYFKDIYKEVTLKNASKYIAWNLSIIFKYYTLPVVV